jgi:hypothetical protein
LAFFFGLLGTQFFGELGIFLEELTRLQLEFASTFQRHNPMEILRQSQPGSLTFAYICDIAGTPK